MNLFIYLISSSLLLPFLLHANILLRFSNILGIFNFLNMRDQVSEQYQKEAKLVFHILIFKFLTINENTSDSEWQQAFWSGEFYLLGRNVVLFGIKLINVSEKLSPPSSV
jgi:hypothetical protein